MDLERLAGERGANEARDDHPVIAALTRADGVEEARDHDVEAGLLVVREREELVHRLRVGVGPAPLGRGAVDAAVVLRERALLTVVAVHLRGRGDEHALVEAVRVLQHDLRPAEVRDERLDGLLDDQSNADRGREVIDDVALVDELVDGGVREHRVDDQVEVRVAPEMLDVRERARRQVVENPDVLPLLEQQL